MTSAIASCLVYDNLHVRPHIIMSESNVKQKLAAKFLETKLEILLQGKDNLPLLCKEKLISCSASYLYTPNSNIQTVMKKNSGRYALGRHNSINFEIGSGSGTVVDTVDREQAADTGVEQVVAGIAFAAFVA